MENEKLLQKYLKEVLSIPSPTGYTKDIIEYIEAELKEIGIEYKISNKGSLLATIKGKNNNESITFSSHVDTLGAIVKEVKNSGRLSISLIGGYMMNTIEGENLYVHTRDGKIYEGTLQTIKPSIHIHGNASRELTRKSDNYEIVLDEEVFEKDDIFKLGIDIGDIVSFDTRTRFTQSGFIKSRYLDDKASVAAILYVIRYIKINDIVPNRTVNFLFSNYEEVGHGSSTFIPSDTVEFIAVDMGCAGDGQNSTEFDLSICTKDSGGPYDYELTSKIVSICKANKISYKLDVYPNYGSDAGAALKAGLNAKFALIGPGIFASHGYERTHIKSILETIKLIVEYIKY